MGREQETKSLPLRFPKKLKDWIETESACTLADQISEILRCIRASMDAAFGILRKGS
jgi:hypothetical protein